MPETFDWLKPSPLWQMDLRDFQQRDFIRPLLLEFRSDSFMEEFFAAAAAPTPATLRSALFPREPDDPRKLYQPAHGRYYLACASLCCRLPGFPDREVQLADGESVFFILRKRVNGAELAWVTEGPKKGWQPAVGAPLPVLTKEERQPLFTTTAQSGRGLFFGYVPVASRDTYAAPATESPIDAPDPRRHEFNATVKMMAEVMLTAGRLAPDKPGYMPPDQVEQATLFFLLDLGSFLEDNVPKVFAVLRGDVPPPTLTTTQQQLVDYLQRAKTAATTLAAAIMHVAGIRAKVKALKPGDPLPVRYKLIDLAELTPNGLEAALFAGDVLVPYKPPTPSISDEVPKYSPKADDQYVLHCVYDRPQCDPPQQWVSQPSEPFQLAPFFDPDAPARPIRIGLPVDVSMAGLRKIKKGVAFMISDALQQKLNRVKDKEKELLSDGEVNDEGGLPGGSICSFSIPIITLCAFILLLVIVVVLNIVFWWLPFFKICLPLKLSSK